MEEREKNEGKRLLKSELKSFMGIKMNRMKISFI